jgi:hypothetical protein
VNYASRRRTLRGADIAFVFLIRTDGESSHNGEMYKQYRRYPGISQMSTPSNPLVRKYNGCPGQRHEVGDSSKKYKEACGVSEPISAKCKAAIPESISANPNSWWDVGSWPRASNLVSKRNLWQGRSRLGFISEYSLIQLTMSCNCDIVHPSVPLKCMYTFLYIYCLCTMLCS